MEFLHKEFINCEHINQVIRQAMADERKLFCRQHHADDQEEVQISCIKTTETHLYFMAAQSAQLKIQINDLLAVHFSVRHENKFLPCEISVRVKSFRLNQGKLFFYTSYPISIRHLQRRLFARYPVTANCFSEMELAFTNSDYFYREKWEIFQPELLDLSNISIGGMMFYLSENESWQKKLSYKSKLVLSCTFNTDNELVKEKNLNSFHIICTILDIQHITHCKKYQIRAKFSHWSCQGNINWKELKKNEGIEPMAKFLFQYAYKCKLPTN